MDFFPPNRDHHESSAQVDYELADVQVVLVEVLAFVGYGDVGLLGLDPFQETHLALHSLPILPRDLSVEYNCW